MSQTSSRPSPSIWITYLFFLRGGDPNQRPVTHSLATVAVVVVAAAASRRHRAVLAGAAAGLLIHFARDIAEGPPGVRMLWPLSNTAWTASARWFWAMIIVFTVVRLTLVTLGIPPRVSACFRNPFRSSSRLPRPSAARPRVIAMRTSRWRDRIMQVLMRPRAPEVGRDHRQFTASASQPDRTADLRSAGSHRSRRPTTNVPNGSGVRPAATTSQSLRQIKSSAPTARGEEAWRDLGDGLDPHDLGAARAARASGRDPPNPDPELSALAPLAVVPAVAAVIIAAYAAWRLVALLALPAALLVMWQLPVLRRARFQAEPWPSRGTGSAATSFRLRLFTVNARSGTADPAAILGILHQHDVDVLAVQELTPLMVTRLAAVGFTQVLPFSHLDPRPGAPGTGLWARWPLAPLQPVPGLTAAAPRARIAPLGGLPVTLTGGKSARPSPGACGQLAA